MRNIQILILLFIALIALVILGAWYFGRQYGMQQVKGMYQGQMRDKWGSFLKDTHFALVVGGRVVSQSGNIWEVEKGGDKIKVFVQTNQKAMRGNSFKGDDYVNWRTVEASEIKVGDEVFVNGYYHPVEKYVVASLIFVKNKQ